MKKQKTSCPPNTFANRAAIKLFEGRKIVVASMHGKHEAMAPLLEHYLHVGGVILPDFDTDEFGTFSGEIERTSDPVTTLRQKILKGLAVAGETLAIGSEGSFGPHPFLPFINANQEFVMLIDLKNDIEIIECVISPKTMHAQKQINSMDDMLDFTAHIGFPSHGIILKQLKDGQTVILKKGILSWDHLYALQLHYSSSGTQLIAETDMRAHMNPTRMKVIKQATRILIKKIMNLCPKCQWPGFGVVEEKNGLPCSECNAPTPLTHIKIYQCKHCGYYDERYYSDGSKADPRYCSDCNP